MLARSPNSAGPLLIAAVSGRALAAAARRAGYRALVADLFGDADTRDLALRTIRLPGDLHAGIDQERTLAALTTLAAEDVPGAVVLGSGFERRPALIDAIAAHWPLAGNRGSVVHRVKNPERLAADCAALGIPHPPLRRDLPRDPAGWLAKTEGAAGGTHVGPIAPVPDRAAAVGRYYQRFVAGRSVSALFVADGVGVHVVGYSRQWTAPAPEARYRYGGAVRLRRFDRRLARSILGWLNAYAARTALVGLCSADFIADGDAATLIEINPRPGATLDIFDSRAAPLLEAHLSAIRGEPFRLPRYANATAAMIAYARRPIARFPALDWPDFTADHQAEGSALGSGDPICTIFAEAGSAAGARRRLAHQAAALAPLWLGESA